MANLDMGKTLYQANKDLNQNEPVLLEVELAAKEVQLKDWLSQHSSNNYFMLLNNELHYYTLFSRINFNEGYGASQIIGCLQDNGKILSIDKDGDAWECWVRDKNQECYLFYLFPYDNGVIEF